MKTVKTARQKKKKQQQQQQRKQMQVQKHLTEGGSVNLTEI